MKKHNSAIMQMILGKRGNMECVPKSDEYKKLLEIVVKKIEEFEKKLKDYPELDALYKELQDATFNENAVLINEVYKEAFSFGLAMGQEVFDD